jgi:coenzyme PQQ precursor peptide PqqA
LAVGFDFFDEIALPLGQHARWVLPTVLHHALWEDQMIWKTPTSAEVPVGMEINMYACAARK